MKRISDIEYRNSNSITKNDLDLIAGSSNGDIRTAIQHLESIKTWDKQLIKESSMTGKDVNRNIFSTLGRILYNKREPIMAPREDTLCDSLQHLKRNPFSLEPEILMEQNSSSVESILLCLQANFPIRNEEIDEVSLALDYMSLGNILASPFHIGPAFESSVSIRGALISCPDSELQENTFQRVQKSSFWDAWNAKREKKSILLNHNQQSLDRLLPHNHLQLILEIVPFMGILSRQLAYNRQSPQNAWAISFCDYQKGISRVQPASHKKAKTQSSGESIGYSLIGWNGFIDADDDIED